MKRERLELPESTGGGAYFSSPKAHLNFIPTGARVLDCAAGGGWVLGRITNIVGDKSTGKTLLAIEACANFARRYKKGFIHYREAEAAFDIPYAEALGMPKDRVDFGNPDKPINTVEDMFNDLEHTLDYSEKTGKPGLYIIDSLDALSDDAEMERNIDTDTFGAAKAKKLSQLFRRLTRRLEASKVCFIVISQIRDNVGAMFGEKTTRSGGKALDFYASQIVFLRHMQTIKKTKLGVERAVGIRIQAMFKKNKVGLPFRKCEFEIRFGFGVDDIVASIEWLSSVKRLKAIGVSDAKGAAAEYLKQIEKLPDEEYFEKLQEIGDVVTKVWRQIETSFIPTRRKYA